MSEEDRIVSPTDNSTTAANQVYVKPLTSLKEHASEHEDLSKHAHRLILLYILILIFAAGIGAVYYWQHKKVEQANSKDATLQSQVTNLQAQLKKDNAQTSTVNSSSQQSDPYSGWKSYTLQYEKISFKYPSNWTLTDKSSAAPKSQNLCTYPGHDIVTITSNSGQQLNINAGQDCFGDAGAKSFGSVPIKSLSQNVYIAFIADTGPYNPTNPSEACLSTTANPTTSFTFNSKNIFYNGSGSNNTPVNSFCYLPYNPSKYQTTPPSFTVSQIENASDYNNAKLIFESMHY